MTHRPSRITKPNRTKSAHGLTDFRQAVGVRQRDLLDQGAVHRVAQIIVDGVEAAKSVLIAHGLSLDDGEDAGLDPALVQILLLQVKIYSTLAASFLIVETLSHPVCDIQDYSRIAGEEGQADKRLSFEGPSKN